MWAFWKGMGATYTCWLVFKATRAVARPVLRINREVNAKRHAREVAAQRAARRNRQRNGGRSFLGTLVMMPFVILGAAASAARKSTRRDLAKQRYDPANTRFQDPDSRYGGGW